MAQNKPKKQHYVPCAYLARFSPDSDREPRKCNILRTDSNIENRAVPVETQCYKKFYYEEENTQRIEDELKEIEDELQRITEHCIAGMPEKRDLKMLIFHHAFMFCRGQAVDNVGDESKYSAYNRTSNLLLANYFYNKPIADLRNKEFAKYLFDHYGSIVLKSDDESLITSDNPVLVFQSNDEKHAALSIMPLTSHRVSVVFHREYVRTKQTKLNDADVGFLNGSQAWNSHEAVFSFDELPDKDLIAARKWFAQRVNPKVLIDDKSAIFDLPLVSTVADRLSFVCELL